LGGEEVVEEALAFFETAPKVVTAGATFLGVVAFVATTFLGAVFVGVTTFAGGGGF
jgi:hypothetical protein